MTVQLANKWLAHKVKQNNEHIRNYYKNANCTVVGLNYVLLSIHVYKLMDKGELDSIW